MRVVSDVCSNAMCPVERQVEWSGSEVLGSDIGL